jgi:hypothetical protein
MKKGGPDAALFHGRQTGADLRISAIFKEIRRI